MNEMKIVIIATTTAAVISLICNRISAVHTLNIIDGYVKSMIDLAKESIRDAYSDKRPS